MKRRLHHPLLQALFVISLIWTSGLLAWGSLRWVDFGYPLLYAAMDIDSHIDRYGPRNRFKHGFENTSRGERLALFAGIVDAVHESGAGLAELSYLLPDGKRAPLLREPEQVHLRSVARLIDALRLPSYAMVALLAGVLAVMRAIRVRPPRARQVLLGSVAVAASTSLGVAAYGAEAAFYAWHEVVFPAGEQWYFYYQESLMTTLMKAPDLFGGIALLLVAAAIIWVLILSVAARRFLLAGGDGRHAPYQY